MSRLGLLKEQRDRLQKEMEMLQIAFAILVTVTAGLVGAATMSLTWALAVIFAGGAAFTLSRHQQVIAIKEIIVLDIETTRAEVAADQD